MFSGRKRKADEEIQKEYQREKRPYKAAGGNENRVSQAFLH